MCGILGFFDNHGDVQPKFDDLLDTLKNRGPNDRGVWVSEDRKIFLGHTRLSVIDLSKNGKQPMISSNQRYIIVYNGEIYNFLEIKQKILEKKNIHFKSMSDTEILLESINFLGLESTLDLIDGMYAFCVFDRKNKELILARDKFGEKPLYFGNLNSNFFFSSDLAFLKKKNNINLTINKDSVKSLLNYSYIPAPYTIYDKIYKLESNSYLKIKISNLEKKLFPRPEDFKKNKNINLEKPNIKKNLEENSNTLEKLIYESIQSRLISDVPVGCFLSGGIDSSLIASIMQRVSNRPIETFSIGQSDSKYNELHYAKKVSNVLKTNHNEFEINSNDILNTIENINEVYSEPFADSSQIPSILLSEKVKKKVTVALSGDAGDELFGGYNRYLYSHKMMRYFNTIPFKFRANFAEILKKIGVNNFDKIGMFTNKFLGTKISNLGDKADKILEKMTYVKNDKQLFISYLSQWKDNDDIFYNQKIKDNVIKEHFYSLDENQLIIERMMSSDLKFYLSDDILCKVDRSAMYHGLETRVPFLSKKIYNFSQMLPYNQKIKGTKGKIILRKILSRHIPKNLIERPKMGFSIPLDQYLRTSLKKWSLDLVNRTELYDEYFDSKVVLDVWNKHQSGKYNYQTKLWPILTFISWRKYNL